MWNLLKTWQQVVIQLHLNFFFFFQNLKQQWKWTGGEPLTWVWPLVLSRYHGLEVENNFPKGSIIHSIDQKKKKITTWCKIYFRNSTKTFFVFALYWVDFRHSKNTCRLMRRERITCTLDSHYIIMILCIINNNHFVTSRSADELHNRVKRTGNDLNVSHNTNISINSFVPKLNINTWLLHLHWYYSTGVEQHYYTAVFKKKNKVP